MRGTHVVPSPGLSPALYRNGLLLTIVTLIAIEGLTRAGVRVPTPGAILLLPVAYTAFTGGLRAGLVGAALMFVYALYRFADPGQFFHYTSDNVQTIIAFALVAGAMVVMVGNLKQRIEQLSRDNQLILQKDITERIRAEAALQASQQHFRALIENSPDAIALFDAAGAILYGSPATMRILGYSLDEFVGHNAFDLIHPDDHAIVQRQLAEALQTPATAVAVQARVRHKDGAWRFLEGIFTNLLDDPNVRAVVNNYRDATERKLAEDAIKRLNADLEQRVLERTAQLEATNKELEAFSYSVSHDLRAPLRSIDGFSQALLEDYGDQLDASGQDFLRRVRTATQRMAQLIDDLLSLARVTRSELQCEAVDLSALTATIVDELQQAHPDRQVEIIITPGLVVRGDKQLLRVALENLLGNAWKFTVTRQCVSIAFGTVTNNGHSAYFVRDDGAGFDMAYADKLFGAFQRLHAMSEFPGTGIGLATVQRIIQRHGGRVWAEGAVGRGATFYFTLESEARQSWTAR